jgi:hypothetical protein
MDEHDDDLASEVIEGEEIESETFDADDDVVRDVEQPEEDDEESSGVDDSEI